MQERPTPPGLSISGDVGASVSTVGKLTVTGIQGNPVSATPATAGQFLIENAGATGSAWTSISGDVSASTGTPGALTVTGLQGRSVSSSAPSLNQVLGWNGTAWTPATLPAAPAVTGSGVWHSTAGALDAAASKGTAGQFLLTNAGATDTVWASISGDATASTSTPGALTVTKIQGNPVSAGAATAGQFLVENAGATGSAWTSISGDVSASTGTPGALTVTKIQGSPVSATPPTAGQFLIEGASSWAPTTLSGDVFSNTVTIGKITVTGLQNNPVSASSPSTNQVLVWSGTTWTPTTLSATQLPNLAGDVTGAVNATVVGKLQGSAVSAASPSTNQVLTWSGTAWTPTTLTATQLPNLAGDVTGAVNATVVGKIQGNAVSAAGPTANQVLVWNTGSTSWVPTTLTATQLPNLAGDVTGAVNATVVVQVHGATVPIAGALTTGNVLQVTGISTLSYAAINLAGGANFVTGVLPAGNQANQSLGGDLTGTTASATVVALRNNPISAGVATAGQFLIENAGASASAWTSLSGDVSASVTTPGKLTITGLQGRSVVSAVPTSGQVLTWGGSSWGPSAPLLANHLSFFSSATFTVPANVFVLLLEGWGGGGGGGGGGNGTTATAVSSDSGAGGGGALSGSAFIDVNPGDVVTVSIGGGGNGTPGQGQPGSPTTFSISGALRCSFVGASGGQTAVTPYPPMGGAPVTMQTGSVPGVGPVTGYLWPSAPGQGGTGGIGALNYNGTPGLDNPISFSGALVTGGTPGSLGASFTSPVGLGGGGGGGGPGGQGADGGNGGGAGGTTGGNATAGLSAFSNTGAGGGGGGSGGCATVTPGTGATGGNGGSGFAVIRW